MMRFTTLQDWLNWQEGLNPKHIDLGLDRVQQVLEKLNLSSQFYCPVITVAGTNGKGSSVAMLESILQAGNYAVGCYTSPHLLKYNERIRVRGREIDDQALCQAFDRVDQARGDIALTYFEFGTLAALVIFAEAELDAVVLEVGLGGRLDAVNVIDADVALVTSVDVDHTDWLGHDIESIAREKAGIFRAGRPAVYGGLKLPDSVLQTAVETGAQLLVAGRDYLYQGLTADTWQLKGPDIHYSELPVPALKGHFQLQNAAAVIVALNQLKQHLPLQSHVISRGLEQVVLRGRYQTLQMSPQVIVDVAHNPQAAQALAELLLDTPVTGRTLAVVAMLADKAVADVVQAMQAVVDEWFVAGLDIPRGLDAESMAKAVNASGADVKLSSQQNVTAACEQVIQRAQQDDRIIVFGSFYTVSAAVDFFKG